MTKPSLTRRSLAEGLATFALVFAGCGAIVVDSERGGLLGAAGISAVFGLVIMVMIYATGHLSGAHINPAVTIGFAVTRQFPIRDAAAYIPAQLGGAVAGAALLRVAWHGTPAHLGATAPSVATGSALLYEIVLTAFLMFVIVAVATDTRAVALDALFGGGVTGASMNPARSFGPALLASEWKQFWIYVVGPIAGALVGAVLYQHVRTADAAPRTAADWATARRRRSSGLVRASSGGAFSRG